MGIRRGWGWALAGVMIIGVAVGTYRLRHPARGPGAGIGVKSGIVDLLQGRAPSAGPLNLLIMGVDEDKTRTDVVILAHWEPAARQLNLVSLPRDTMVEIPCPRESKACISPDKLGHAHAYGYFLNRGPELAIATVEGFLGVKVDHYVRLDFDGFAQLIDLMGGIDIDVEKPMDDVQIPAGRQHLDGKRALQYVRFRSDGQGDIGRIERTHHFLQAIVDAAPNSGLPDRIPAALVSLAPHMATDLDPMTLIGLAKDWRSGARPALQFVTLPGEPRYERNLWFWIADPKAKAEIVRRYITAVEKPPPSE